MPSALSWYLWLLLAALLVLPVALRTVAEEPDNAMYQEQPSGGDRDGDDSGAALAAA